MLNDSTGALICVSDRRSPWQQNSGMTARDELTKTHTALYLSLTHTHPHTLTHTKPPTHTCADTHTSTYTNTSPH